MYNSSTDEVVRYLFKWKCHFRLDILSFFFYFADLLLSSQQIIKLFQSSLLSSISFISYILFNINNLFLGSISFISSCYILIVYVYICRFIKAAYICLFTCLVDVFWNRWVFNTSLIFVTNRFYSFGRRFDEELRLISATNLSRALFIFLFNSSKHLIQTQDESDYSSFS
jgi:hypothetical protein